jgi:hypothetical protein
LKKPTTAQLIALLGLHDVIYFHPVVNPYGPPAVQEARRKARRAVTEEIFGKEALRLDDKSIVEPIHASHSPTEHVWQIVRRKLAEAAKKARSNI